MVNDVYFRKESAMNKEALDNKKVEIATKTAAAFAVSLVITLASIASLTAVYCKSLMDIKYFNDDDVYHE